MGGTVIKRKSDRKFSVWYGTGAPCFAGNFLNSNDTANNTNNDIHTGTAIASSTSSSSNNNNDYGTLTRAPPVSTRPAPAASPSPDRHPVPRARCGCTSSEAGGTRAPGLSQQTAAPGKTPRSSECDEAVCLILLTGRVDFAFVYKRGSQTAEGRGW